MLRGRTNQSMTTNFSEFYPIIISDVLSEDQYRYVYECVNSALPDGEFDIIPPDNRENPLYMSVDSLGYIAYIGKFNQEFVNHIKTLVEEKVQMPLQGGGIHFARYTNKSGSKPQLPVHFDMSLDSPHLTLSVQLDTTMDWELCAYQHSATLAKNEALVFSGSHQLHWRPEQEFSDEDYFDILVCQFKVNDDKLPEDHFKNMFELKDMMRKNDVSYDVETIKIK